MKRCVTKVFLCFLQHTADSFLFGDVVVEFLNVPLRLLGASTFRFLGITRRSLYFAHVAVVTVVDDDDYWNTDEQRPNAGGAHAADDESRTRRAGKVTNRNPQEVAGPHLPNRFASFEGGSRSANHRVDEILDQTHQAKCGDGDRSEEHTSELQSRLHL